MRLTCASGFFAVCAAVILWSAGGTARAQFAGNSGDGYTREGLIHRKLDGVLLSAAPFSSSESGDGYSLAGTTYVPLGGSGSASPPAYTGGNSGGDGYAVGGVSFQRLSGGGLFAFIYSGSDSGGDGYDNEGRLMTPLNGAASPLVLYRGSDTGGDGFAVDRVSGVPMSGDISTLVLYRGSDSGGDGYDVEGTRHTSLSVLPVTAEAFTGSDNGGDGYDREGVIYTPLNGVPSARDMYTSSESGGDGYDRDGAIFVSLSGAVASAVAYTGSDSGGDGYDTRGARHQPLNPAADTGLAAYTGGGGDGYDRRGLINVQYLGGGAAASGITYESWLSSRFTESELASGIAAPEADADGDGLANLIEFAVGSDPREQDAAFYGPQFRLSNLLEFGLPPLNDRYLTAVVRRNPLALDATLKAEVSDTPESFWSTNETVIVDQSAGVFIVRDRQGLSTAPLRLMRFRATLNSAP